MRSVTLQMLTKADPAGTCSDLAAAAAAVTATGPAALALPCVSAAVVVAAAAASPAAAAAATAAAPPAVAGAVAATAAAAGASAWDSPAAAAAACCCICFVTRSQMSCRIGKTWWGNSRARQRQPSHQCACTVVPYTLSPLLVSTFLPAPPTRSHALSLARPQAPLSSLPISPSKDLLRVVHLIHGPPLTSHTHTHSPSPLPQSPPLPPVATNSPS